MLKDTDSVFLGLTKTGNMPKKWEDDLKSTFEALFYNIVQDGKLEAFKREAKNWFVLDQSVESKRKPGPFK